MGEEYDWRSVMKRLFIVVEGQTEQEFVNEVIAPYLRNFEIYSVTPLLIRTSRFGRGGMANYEHLRNTIKMSLVSKQEDFIVTTLIDFFRIPKNMPSYKEAMDYETNAEQVIALEKAINDDINDRRFFSYIQLHEFEALLFSNNKGFESCFDENVARKTSEIISSYPNPEDINSSPQGAPSKRLIAIKNDYNKVIEGNIIAIEVGINSMLEKCPRFAEWIDRIINRCN